MRRYFPAAPWPLSLKLLSTLATLGLAVAAIAAYRAAPAAAGFTRSFGLGVALIPVAVLVGGVLFMVTGYAVDSGSLFVERPLGTTRLELAGLSIAWIDPMVCRGMLRIFGNGGLYSFTGLYYKKKLGRFRLFATNPAQGVVLVLPHRTVVVTPADPEGFLACLKGSHPNLEERVVERAAP